ncbi:MAG TPA: hypothetical protein VJT31_07635, partial [Rugosimonospora sp.]|nr:hypothetical protein [Rugosimonospora sp.]
AGGPLGPGPGRGPGGPNPMAGYPGTAPPPRAAQPPGRAAVPTAGMGHHAAPERDDLPLEGGDRWSGGEVGRPRGQAVALLLAGLSVVLLGILPVLFLLRDSGHDPVYAALDALDVPGWAQLAHEDTPSGNRYCVQTCALHERVVQSGRNTAQTDAAFEGALRTAGWARVTDGRCPTARTGVYTCWQRDQYVLDLWARDADCNTSQLGGPNPGPSMVVPSNEVESVPSAPPAVPPSRTGPVTAACPLSQVTVKVGNRADPRWHQ